MDKLAETNKAKVIDLLTERLHFERAAVKLYDAILAKMQRSNDPSMGRLFGPMQDFRDEEKTHEEWLTDQIRALGGDVDADTEMSKLVETESEGIGKVVLNGDPSVAHSFHALLTAELVDNAGWQLLIQLADEADDAEARKMFKKFLHEEEEHVIFVRRVVTMFARKDVLGREVVAHPLV